MAHPELKSRPSAEDAALLGSSALSLREKEDLLFRLPLEIGLTAEDLASTDQHRLIVGVASALLVALLGKGLLACHGTPDTIEVTIAAALAYILSDLGSGVYHWAIDNYGDANTPIFGQQIAGFQGHHEFPWTITMRGFANNVHKTFAPTIPFALLYLATSESASWDVFAATFMFFVAASQQLHSWSHMKRSELPATVIALQEAGLLISRKAHGAHHLPPFEDNYCIVSGVWNPWLDRSGVFRVLERAVYAVTGLESHQTANIVTAPRVRPQLLLRDCLGVARQRARCHPRRGLPQRYSATRLPRRCQGPPLSCNHIVRQATATRGSWIPQWQQHPKLHIPGIAVNGKTRVTRFGKHSGSGRGARNPTTLGADSLKLPHESQLPVHTEIVSEPQDVCNDLLRERRNRTAPFWAQNASNKPSIAMEQEKRLTCLQGGSSHSSQAAGQPTATCHATTPSAQVASLCALINEG
eukprot:jgi/Mesvir1/15860/Mv03406-RA.1